MKKQPNPALTGMASPWGKRHDFSSLVSCKEWFGQKALSAHAIVRRGASAAHS